MQRRGLARILLITLSFITVSVALSSVPDSAIQYWYLFYSPVLLASLSFGLRGALAGTVAATLHILAFYRVTYVTQASLVNLLDRLTLLSDVPVQEAVPFILSAGKVQTLDLPFELTKAMMGILLIMAGALTTGWLVEENRRQQRLLQLRATTDGLTDLANHRRLQECLEMEISRVARYGDSFALLMLDIDSFKAFNDAHGHLAGDTALRSAAHTMVASVRNVDLVARYGGEEFAVILLRADAPGALVAAERIRSNIECLGMTVGQGELVRITVSIGVALCPTHAIDRQALTAAADAALYQAKEQGRNRVVLFGEGQDSHRCAHTTIVLPPPPVSA